ncbi:cytochrome c oxidase assembly protein subunit 15 [Paenibacillus forsythiae]|uniref:Cytochrome c oxidase assembly protein subunit 15 n=1 Tax=Paenibacillus forsythiae TaxID=365616 RepID=A0ABU3HAK7_9BACL|nr:COX15/CtaA family protein [Paenibacillus forsythiae]MDT3427854.1 cytochrome c oxidase assembly protein subunit 15 [Paenibacillus forsythiae]
MTAKPLKWLGYITCLIMFLALLGGAVVTKTGSGLECGNEWPLCNGKLVPAYTLGQMIEWSHRLFSGLAGLASLASVLAFRRYARNRRDLQAYAYMTLLFVVIQAFMGALAVVRPQTAAVMALHMGFSLIAFASSLMLALGAGSRYSGEQTGALPPVGKGFRNLTWITAIYAYIVVYVGALVSHTGSQGGCSGWPLCNGEVIPELSGGTGIMFVHRIAAMLLFVLTAVLGHLAFWRHGRYPELGKLGALAVALCALQVLSGASVVFTLYNEQWYLFAALAHIVLVSGLFGVLCYMSVRVWQLGRIDREKDSAEIGHFG